MKKFMDLLEKDLHRNRLLSKDKNISLPYLLFKIVASYNASVLFWIRIATCEVNILSMIARRRLKSRYGVELGPNIKIGQGFSVPHPFGIIVSGDVVIGEDVIVGQYVTIGGNFKKSKIINGVERKLPIIGDRVWICPGSVVGGPVNVGSDVIIGANSVITRDVPSNSIAYGANHLDKRKIKFDPDGAFTILGDGKQEDK